MAFRYVALAVSVLAIAGVGTGAEAPGPREDPDAAIVAGEEKLPGLRLELVVPKKRYELGEPVQVTMRYTYSGERRLSAKVVTYDRSGRIDEFRFTAEDEEGNAVRDPIKGWTGCFGGGARGEQDLAPGKPYEQNVAVNEWLCFDRPGEYRLTAHSKIVSFDYYGTGSGGPGIPLVSEPVGIVIVPPDDERRLERIARAEEILKTGDDEAREDAMRELRFMADPRAVALLVRWLEDPSGNVYIHARFGLVSLLDPGPMKTELLKVVNDEAQVLTPRKIWLYAELLAFADSGAEGGRFSEGRGEASSRWRDILADRFRENLDKYPRAESARAAVEGLDGMRILSRADPANWRRVIDRADVLSRIGRQRAASLIESACRCKELIPDLKTFAADEAAPGDMRSGAVMALRVMGDDSLRDMVAEDLMSPRPKLFKGAHATLGDYRAREVAEALLRLIETGDREVRKWAAEGRRIGKEENKALSARYEVRVSAAERLRDFGAAATADELRDAMQRRTTDNVNVQGPVLEALAMKSPEDVLPFTRYIVYSPTLISGPRGDAIRLLSRIDSPQAQDLIAEVFRSPEDIDRASVSYNLRNSWSEAESLRWDGPPVPSVRRFRRGMPPNAELAGAFVPELLMLYKTDPSAEVRLAARGALGVIAGVPAFGFWQETEAEIEVYAREWESWWRKNGARFGRWGRARRGLAIKCSTDKGEYELGEQVGLTVRCRRISEGEDARPKVRLYGLFRELGAPRDSDGEAHEREIEAGELRPTGRRLLPGPARGSEAVYRFEMQNDPYRGHRPGLDRPCTLRFRVQYLFRGASKPSRKDAVESYPVTIHVRELPEDVAWSEVKDGLSVGVSLPKRSLIGNESVPVEIRFKNTRREGTLTIPSPRRGRFKPRFLRFALRDARGEPIDMGGEPQSVRDRLPQEASGVGPIRLGPGQMCRMRAYLASAGCLLRWHPDGILHQGDVRKGGRFTVALTYEVPAEVRIDGVEDEPLWRGALTVEVGEISIRSSSEAGP